MSFLSFCRPSINILKCPLQLCALCLTYASLGSTLPRRAKVHRHSKNGVGVPRVVPVCCLTGGFRAQTLTSRSARKTVNPKIGRRQPTQAPRNLPPSTVPTECNPSGESPGRPSSPGVVASPGGSAHMVPFWVPVRAFACSCRWARACGPRPRSAMTSLCTGQGLHSAFLLFGPGVHLLAVCVLSRRALRAWPCG